MNKKLLHLFCLSLPLQTFAQLDFNQNGVQYQLYTPDNASPYAVVTGYTDIENQILEIPESLVVDGHSYSVTKIGNNALAKSSILGAIIPATVTSIGTRAFADCEELVQVIFPEGLIEIGDSAFYNCWELSSLNIPASIKTIGDYAFESCYNLSAVVYKTDDPISANSTIFINSSIFNLYVKNGGRNKALQTEPWRSFSNVFEIDTDNTVLIDDIEYTLTDFTTFDDPHTPLANITGNMLREPSDVKIKSTITVDGVKYNIGDITEYALSGCIFLKSVSISEIENFYISDRTFHNCKMLESVDLPKSLSGIGYKAFYGCSNLSTLTIPEPIRFLNIYDYAFENCGIKTLSLPESIDYMGEMVFEGCPLKEIYYDSPNPINCNPTIFDSNTYRYATLNIAPGTMEDFWETEPWNKFSNITESYDCIPITRQDGLKFRADEVVGYYFTEPTDVRIPIQANGYVINSIGKNAFGMCNNMKSIYIPETIHTITPYAFSKCSGLSEIAIPYSVTSLGQYAFQYCTGLKSIDLPYTITSIDRGAFQACKSLKSIDLPSSLTEIEPGLFNICDSLISVEIPNSVKSIGWWAFQGCRNLKIINLPDGLKTISYQAFVGCSNLEKVIIPPSVEEIHYGAFQSCKNISHIEYICDEPVAFEKEIFDEYSYDNATLHIAKGARAKIMVTEPWMYFKNITEDVTTVIEDTSLEDDIDSDIIVYNLNGVKIGDSTANLTPGLYILRQGSKAYKVSIK